MTSSTHSPTAPERSHRRALRAGFAASVGTTIEWYDFYVYATAAAIVFPQVFFPEVDRTLGTLASFGTYAVAFFVRPLGGIIFGHIGDRLGRKPALTITLMLMGVATVLVGCLPGYATLGATAAVLLILLRIVQGLAVGGEWGGASLMAVESAPEKFKTFYGGFTQLGNPLGALLSSGAFWALSLMGEEALFSWGWRIPFLASIILIGVGIWVRLRVEETPVFEESGSSQSTPILYALRFNWYPILLGFGMVAIASGGYYLATTYVQSYATSPDVGLAASIILGAMTVASFLEAVVTLPLAWLGDKWGSKMLMYLGVGLSFLCAIPLVLVIEGHNVLLIYILVSAIRVTMSATWAPLSALMSQMYRPQARYTSMSLAYGVGAAVWGGLSPIAATTLQAATGTVWSVIGLFAFLSIVAWVSTALAPQHKDDVPVTH
ncbi:MULTISPECIES: MFS transporter [unclassified Brevibacterium]|uniref:MFS transporter n=1 Tax=unclassified Brevibacterium TaxID=2614124 RepID=UPI0010F7A377|nr:MULTISPECIES: MFS transporter [unclassified Brevibacterium]MCM1013048.1 MHS family MFS transporter [Brevibacterium sp. XM4083]